MPRRARLAIAGIPWHIIQRGNNRSARRALFNAHVEAKQVDEIRTATNSNYALGNERFREEIEQELKRRAARGTNGRPKKVATLS